MLKRASLILGVALCLAGCAHEEPTAMLGEAEEETGRVVIESVQPSGSAAVPKTQLLQQVNADMSVIRESIEGAPVQVTQEGATTNPPSFLRIQAQTPGRHYITLARLENLDWPKVQALVYQTKLKTQGLKGKVSLVMSAYVEGRMPAEATNGLETGFTKDTYPDWATLETVYFTRPGDRIGQVELFLVLDGTGTVWVDDIQVLNRSIVSR